MEKRRVSAAVREQSAALRKYDLRRVALLNSLCLHYEDLMESIARMEEEELKSRDNQKIIKSNGEKTNCNNEQRVVASKGGGGKMTTVEILTNNAAFSGNITFKNDTFEVQFNTEVCICIPYNHIWFVAPPQDYSLEIHIDTKVCCIRRLLINFNDSHVCKIYYERMIQKQREKSEVPSSHMDVSDIIFDRVQSEGEEGRRTTTVNEHTIKVSTNNEAFPGNIALKNDTFEIQFKSEVCVCIPYRHIWFVAPRHPYLEIYLDMEKCCIDKMVILCNDIQVCKNYYEIMLQKQAEKSKVPSSHIDVSDTTFGRVQSEGEEAIQQKSVTRESRASTSTSSGCEYSKSSSSAKTRTPIPHSGDSIPVERNIRSTSNSAELQVSDYDSRQRPSTSKDFPGNNSQDDISTLLTVLGLEKYIDLFKSHAVDINMFPKLTKADLKRIGVSSFGARRKLLAAIAGYKKKQKMFPGSAAPSSEHKSPKRS